MPAAVQIVHRLHGEHDEEVRLRLVVLGGGLVHRFRQLPKGIERGQNENAYLGGVRLWETKKNSRELKWRVL